MTIRPKLRILKHSNEGRRVTGVAVAAILCVPTARVAPQVYVLAVAAGAMLLIGIGWPWLASRMVSGRISAGIYRTVAGEAATMSLSLSNRAPLALPAFAIDGPATVRVDANVSLIVTGTTDMDMAVEAPRGVLRRKQSTPDDNIPVRPPSRRPASCSGRDTNHRLAAARAR